MELVGATLRSEERRDLKLKLSLLRRRMKRNSERKVCQGWDAKVANERNRRGGAKERNGER